MAAAFETSWFTTKVETSLGSMGAISPIPRISMTRVTKIKAMAGLRLDMWGQIKQSGSEDGKPLEGGAVQVIRLSSFQEGARASGCLALAVECERGKSWSA